MWSWHDPADSRCLEDDPAPAAASRTKCISSETAFPIKEGDVRIFRRKSRWQRLSKKLASMSKKPAIKGGAAAATGAVALTAASAAVSSYRRRTNA